MQGKLTHNQLTAFIILLSHATHDSNTYRAIESCAQVTDRSTASRHCANPEVNKNWFIYFKKIGKMFLHIFFLILHIFLG